MVDVLAPPLHCIPSPFPSKARLRSDLADLASEYPICSYKGDRAIGEACFGKGFRYVR
jgi:hypothetical protein